MSSWRIVAASGIVALLLPTPTRADPAAGSSRTSRLLLPPRSDGLFLACDAAMRERLRAAWNGTGRAKNALATMVGHAEAALGEAIIFPPRGGKHQQWYQCDPCQRALNTVSDTEHACPACGHVYSGEPYDDVVFSRMHGQLLSRVWNAAWVWTFTEDRRFAEYAARILTGYAERYLTYPYRDNRTRTGDQASRSGGRMFTQTLDEAVALATRIAPALDLIFDSGVLTSAEREAVRKRLILPMLENIGGNRTGKNNWQSWHNAAMLWGGALLGDAAWIERAIHDPEDGFFRQMEISVTPEGMWYEASWGYHFYALRALVRLAEGARPLGVDLWSHPVLRKMFFLPSAYAMPDGTLPRFGNDTRSLAHGIAPDMEAAYFAYRNPAIFVHLPKLPTFDSIRFGRAMDGDRPPQPHMGSRLFRGGGHAILRTKGEAGLMSAMIFGEPGGFHGHFDKLGFVLFGFGRELGVDRGRAEPQAYRMPIHSRWYRATLSHNTVVVDGVSQAPATGRALVFGANEQFAVAVADAGPVYPALAHRRMLAQTPEYLVVIDHLMSSNHSDRPFAWFYHNRGTEVVSETEVRPARTEKGLEGAEYLDDYREGTLEGWARVRFVSDDVTTHVLGTGGSGTRWATANGPGSNIKERIPLMAMFRRGQSAMFAAILEPTKDGQAPTVTAAEVNPAGNGMLLRIRRDSGTDEFEWMPGGVTVRRAGQTVLIAPRLPDLD